jgi:hypothetical protein
MQHGSAYPAFHHLERRGSVVSILKTASKRNRGSRKYFSKLKDPDLDPDLSIDQEKRMGRLGCVSVAAGATLNLRCHSYNFQFFLQM